MFRFARFIVQHKVGAVALVALGVVMLAPDEQDQAASSSPWSAPAQPAFAEAEETGFVDDIISEADTMLAESGMDPRDEAEEAVNRFDDTAGRYSQANNR